ncbi:hypothetical protein BYT27DRAFT_7218520 [Phlegmacium glaucopus]|nr:hypothetical protein BYT27DRAFT_7218520 [Phlegmacium glaucopus]
MVKEDPKYQNLTKMEEQELRDEVMSLREQKKIVVIDYYRHLTVFNDERTGAAVVAFFSRSHIEDMFEPNWICTPNATNFTQDTLNYSMWDITQLFEQWSCSKAKVQNPNCLATMQTECSATINGTLKTASRSLKAIMNYINYDIQVVQKHQCKLVGWTFNKFISPFDIHTIDDLRTLRDALHCGACHWVRMTKAEVSKHAADLVHREVTGEMIGKKRKERSDKGVKKGLKAKPGVSDGAELDDNSSDADNSDNDDQVAGPSKKRKTTVQTKPATKTKPKQTPKTKAASKRKGKAKVSSQLPPSREMVSNTDESELDSDNNG